MRQFSGNLPRLISNIDGSRISTDQFFCNNDFQNAYLPRRWRGLETELFSPVLIGFTA
jgi:hypothetical protein